jgi:hypothetical protein
LVHRYNSGNSQRLKHSSTAEPVNVQVIVPI